MLGAVKGKKTTSQIKSSGVRGFCFGAQERAALAFPGPHCIAAAADEKARRGRARIARIPLLHTDVQLAEPVR